MGALATAVIGGLLYIMTWWLTTAFFVAWRAPLGADKEISGTLASLMGRWCKLDF